MRAEASVGTVDGGLASELDFETDQTGDIPTGWHGGPPGTIHADSAMVHSGKWAARIERTADSPKQFSTMTKSIPMDFAGSRIEFRGFVRTEDVSSFAGLWLREDGAEDSLEFDNMQSRQLKGTNDWKEYSIVLPLNPDGRKLFFGFLMAGTGKAWVDDLQLLVDGKPVWEAPKVAPVQTVLDRDHEFDGGSKINVSELTSTQIENLATLCKVWGFLKYRDVVVTSGAVHWDYELFRIMPKVMAAADCDTANAAIVQWIDGMGKIQSRTASEQDGQDIYMRPDVSWITNESLLGKELSNRLISIGASRHDDGAQFYLSFDPGAGNPVFTHELGYSHLRLPDTGYQLLGLFRFWNIIRYWYPYRDLIKDDWNVVLKQSISRIGLATNVVAYQLEFMALIAKVHDTHANLWSSLGLRPPVGESSLPVRIRFIQGAPVVVEAIVLPEPAGSGFQRGDEIREIAGVPVEALMRDWSPYYAASNEPTRLRDIAKFMGRGEAGPVTVKVRREGRTIDVNTSRVPIAKLPAEDAHDRKGPTFCLLSPEVAYLKLSTVKAADTAAYVEQSAGTKGLIIDLRNYPSEFVVFALGEHLVDKATEFARFTGSSLENPGEFSFGPPISIRPKAPYYSGKVVILVDESSQSQAEYTAMAFRASAQAVVIGSTTAGADGNVSRIMLPGGFNTMVSGIGVFYPDKRPTQQVGILPDITISPTITGIRDGRDEVLDEAVRQISALP